MLAAARAVRGYVAILRGACFKLNPTRAQGFYTAVDREMLQCWRVTPSDLAELAAGRKLDGLAEGGVRSRSQQLPGGIAAAAPGVIAPNAQAHVATSNAPVVNTLWKVCRWYLCRHGQLIGSRPQLQPTWSSHICEVVSPAVVPADSQRDAALVSPAVVSDRWLTVTCSCCLSVSLRG